MKSLNSGWAATYDHTKTHSHGIEYNGTQKIQNVFGFQVTCYEHVDVENNQFIYHVGWYGGGQKNVILIERPIITEELFRDSTRWVHGSFEDFMQGKVCVIMEDFHNIVDLGERVVDATFDQNCCKGDKKYTGEVYRKMVGCPFKSIKTNFGTIIVIGKTPSNNLKIVLKK